MAGIATVERVVDFSSLVSTGGTAQFKVSIAVCDDFRKLTNKISLAYPAETVPDTFY